VVELQAPYNPNGYYSIYWKTSQSVDCLASPFVTSMPLKGILLLEGQKQVWLAAFLTLSPYGFVIDISFFVFYRYL
jgi:hypothetical protein